MASSAQLQRALAAVKAMKLIGFDQGLAKTVLKKLLKVYENNWAYIEAENYRLLADAILDNQESKDPEANEKDNAVSDEPEISRKRLRRKEDPGPSQSTIEPEASGETLQKKRKLLASAEGPLMNLRDEMINPVEDQCSYEGRGTSSSPESLLKNGTAGIGEIAQHANNCEESSRTSVCTIPRITRSMTSTHGAQPEKGSLGSCSRNHRDEQYLCGKAGNAICYKEPKIEPDIEVLQETAAVGSTTIPDKPMDEIRNDISENNVPIAGLAFNGNPSGIVANQDEAQKGGFCGANASSGLTHASNMQLAPNKGDTIECFQVSAQKEAMSELANVQERLSTNVNIASSNMGKVKLSLTCSFDCKNFKMHSIESVFKIVEDKCLKSYKILQPDFSLVNLMNEICQSAADLSVELGNLQEDVVKLSPLQESFKSSRLPGIHHGMTRRSFIGSLNLVSLETPRKSMNGLESSQHIDGDSNDIQENFTPASSDNNASQCLTVFPQHENVDIASSPLHDENDIAKGEERIRISLINEFTSEKTPPYFHYLPGNAVYQNAHVNFCLARIGEEDCCINCFDNCLSAPTPCACTRETGGEFVYTLDGLLKKEFLNECISMNCYSDKHHHVYCKNCPIEKFKSEDTPDACKGHLVRKFIKECWSKCGCNKRCGNRVVQRGITSNLQVFYTAYGKGWGLRTLEKLPRGAFVCEYVGEILTSRELYDRTVQRSGGEKHTYPVLLDADWGSEEGLRDEEALCLDATFYGNVGRFVNHRCFDANLVEVPVEWETPNHHYYHLAYFTTRKVEALEELTWDYGIDFKDRTHLIEAFKCLCGSKFCRDSCSSTTTDCRSSRQKQAAFQQLMTTEFQTTAYDHAF